MLRGFGFELFMNAFSPDFREKKEGKEAEKKV